MPIHTAAINYDQHHATPWHQHTSGQLFWLRAGMMIIETAVAQWTVTAGSVGWFPAGLHHRAWVPGTAIGTSLYLPTAFCVHFPAHPAIYGADAFMQALLARICRHAAQEAMDDYCHTLVTLLGYEISQREGLPLHLMLPVDRRARNVADALLQNPDSAWDQRALAADAGLSARSLSRLFRQQTGLSFSQWRQQAKVVVSLQWVLAGMPVSDVALRSGYSNVSAYIAAFRQRFAITPGQLQAQQPATAPTSSPLNDAGEPPDSDG